MAWNDYVFDVDNGSKFECERFQVYFDTIYQDRPQIKDISYQFVVPNYEDYEIESISGGDDELYAIMWFEIPSGDNINPIGRGLNDVALSYTPSLNLPTLHYSDVGDSGIYPLSGIAGFTRSCFVQPTQLIERHVITNIPIVAVCADTVYDEEHQVIYDVETARQAMHLYALSGDWDEYIQPLIDDGYAASMNYTSEPQPEPETEYFNIFNTAQKGIFSKTGYTQTGTSPYYRWVKIKLNTTSSVDGRIAFYRKGWDDGIIKLVPIVGASVYSCEYSTDGVNWNESNSFPFSYIYGERIDEMGEIIHATRTGLEGNYGVPVFATEAEATGWVNHDPNVDISDALNYEGIAGRYGITNPTGAKETATTMGDGGGSLRGYFSHDYIMSFGSVAEISDAFFDVGPQGIWESIKDGIEMMGANPIDCIAGLKCYNLDLTQILTGLSDYSYIYFGGYKYDLQQGNVKRVINYGGYKDLGTFTIEDAFSNPNDFRNFEPYCKLKIYIPTVGIQELSYNKYRGKTITVRMYLDIKSGNTLMCLLANNVLYDYFNGSCGVDLPICLTDKAALSQAQIRNASNLAGVGINMGTAAATKDIGAAVAGVANFGSSMLDLNNTSADQFNVTKGGSSPMGNAYFLPDYIYLIFEYIKTAETGNLQQLEGRITNKSGNLGSFSGHLQVDSIQLQTSANMSESEKNEFISLLQTGIFI